ncbi:MAG: hypothetical protein AB1349_13640 [Elusimicrobiota bacterium]
MGKTNHQKREKILTEIKIPKLIEYFLTTSDILFNFLKTEYNFSNETGIVDFNTKPNKVVKVNYDNIPDFFYITNEYTREDIQFEFAYTPAGQTQGREGIDLLVNYRKGKKFKFRISEVFIEIGATDSWINYMGIGTPQLINESLNTYKKHIESNIEFFLNPDLKILQKILNKRNQKQQEALKKMGFLE